MKRNRILENLDQLLIDTWTLQPTFFFRKSEFSWVPRCLKTHFWLLAFNINTFSSIKSKHTGFQMHTFLFLSLFSRVSSWKVHLVFWSSWSQLTRRGSSVLLVSSYQLPINESGPPLKKIYFLLGVLVHADKVSNF